MPIPQFLAQVIRARAQGQVPEGPLPNTKSVPGVETPTGIKYPADGEYVNVLMGKGMPDISISGNEVPPKEMAKVDNRMKQIESALKNIDSLDLMPDPDSMEGPMAWLYKMRLALNPGMRAEQEARNTQFRMATQMQLTNQYLQLAQFKQQANALSPGEETVQVGDAGIMVREAQMRASDAEIDDMVSRGLIGKETGEAEKVRRRGLRSDVQVQSEVEKFKMDRAEMVSNLANDKYALPPDSPVLDGLPDDMKASYAKTYASRKTTEQDERAGKAGGSDDLADLASAMRIYNSKWEQTVALNTKVEMGWVMEDDGVTPYQDINGNQKREKKYSYIKPLDQLKSEFDSSISLIPALQPWLQDLIGPQDDGELNPDAEFRNTLNEKLSKAVAAEEADSGN